MSDGWYKERIGDWYFENSKKSNKDLTKNTKMLIKLLFGKTLRVMTYHLCGLLFIREE